MRDDATHDADEVGARHARYFHYSLRRACAAAV